VRTDAEKCQRARECQRVGSKPERAAKGQREPGIERKCQIEQDTTQEFSSGF